VTVVPCTAQGPRYTAIMRPLALAAVLASALVATAKDYPLTAKVKSVTSETTSGRGRGGCQGIFGTPAIPGPSARRSKTPVFPVSC